MTPEEQARRVVARLEDKGIRVIDVRMPSRPWSDEMFHPNGVLLHHTASTSVTNPQYSRNDVAVIKNVSWGPPGAQWYVDRAGVVFWICAGGANHAGTGRELVGEGIPSGAGNFKLWGIEVQSDGYGRDWTGKQWEVVHVLTAELLRAMNQTNARRVWRHKDYDDDSGKVDTRYPLKSHREAVTDALQGRKARRRSRLREEIRAIDERIDRLMDKVNPLRRLKARKRRRVQALTP